MRKVLSAVLLTLVSSATFALSCPTVDSLKAGGLDQPTKSQDGKFFVVNINAADAQGEQWVFAIGEISAIGPDDALSKGTKALSTLHHESTVEVIRDFHVCRQYQLSNDYPYIPVAILKSDLTK